MKTEEEKGFYEVIESLLLVLLFKNIYKSILSQMDFAWSNDLWDDEVKG